MILSGRWSQVGRTLLMIDCVLRHDQSKSETDVAKFLQSPERSRKLTILGFVIGDSQNVGPLAIRPLLTGALP